VPESRRNLNRTIPLPSPPTLPSGSAYITQPIQGAKPTRHASANTNSGADAGVPTRRDRFPSTDPWTDGCGFGYDVHAGEERTKD
jgi:hypothetical protein